MTLVRAGVGRLRLIDRDVPELSNLPRQVLFDEAGRGRRTSQGRRGRAAARADQRRRADRAVVADLTAANADELLGGVDVLVDGTDNFETRFLVNEFACRHGVPWVHGGAIGAEGRVMTIVPGTTACLRCLIPEPPAPGSLPTCDTAGIIGPAAIVVGAVEAAEAIKLLAGAAAKAGNRLLVCDLWENVWRTVDLSPLAAARLPDLPGRRFPVARGTAGGRSRRSLCGRDAVQVAAGRGSRRPGGGRRPAGRGGAVFANPWIVRAELEDGHPVRRVCRRPDHRLGHPRGVPGAGDRGALPRGLNAAGRGLHDLLLGGLRAGELRGQRPSASTMIAVGEREEFGQLARREHHRHALPAEAVDERVELGLRARRRCRGWGRRAAGSAAA